MKQIPVIDLFAGPGGLCEGFSRPLGGGHPFRPVLSIEKDETAHRTLELRAFVHWFMFNSKAETLPTEYYQYVQGKMDREQFWAMMNRKHTDAVTYAKDTAWLATLGGSEVPEAEFDRRIDEALNGERDWVLIGGPPCQAYSLAGRSRSVGGIRKRDNLSFEEAVAEFGKDERQTLYKQYLRILAVHKPAVFVMENVSGILSAKVGGEKIFPKIVSDLSNPVRSAHEDWPELEGDESLRYQIFSFATGRMPKKEAFGDYLIRSERYGVPQARHRVILLGIREDFLTKRKRVRSLRQIKSPPSIKNAIGDLPKLRSRISQGGDDTLENWCAFLKEVAQSPAFKDKELDMVREIALASNAERRTWLAKGASVVTKSVAGRPCKLRKWYADERLSEPLNHAQRGHMATDLARYLFVAAFGQAMGRSPVLADFPAVLLPAHHNVNTTGERRNQAFADRFKVQLREKPSSTITCHIAKDGHHYIHYDVSQCRSLTVREAARLQTFPDNYFFEGNQTEQYHQVGNAVPPFLAAQLADIVYLLFLRTKPSGRIIGHEL